MRAWRSAFSTFLLFFLLPLIPSRCQETSHSKLVLMIDTSNSMLNYPDDVTRKWRRNIEEVRAQLARLAHHLPLGTTVRLFEFDVELRDLATVKLESAQDRERLIRFFGQVQPQGQFTHLCEHLDTVLQDIEQDLQREPGRAVRLIVYSDGKNNPSVHGGPTLEEVVANYSSILKDQVQLTYVTLGFELGAKQKQALVSANVSIVKEVVAEKMIPLEPAFDWMPRKVIVGQQIQFVDRSAGLVRERRLQFNDVDFSTDVSPTYTFREPGERDITLFVTSTNGETKSVTRQLVVHDPEPIQAAFELRNEKDLIVGDNLILTNLTVPAGQKLRYQWTIDNEVFSTDLHSEYLATKPGTFQLELQVLDEWGRITTASQSIVVAEAAVTKAEAIFDCPSQIEFGETITLVSQSVGSSTFEWFINEELIEENEVLRFTPDQPQEYRIRLSVRGETEDDLEKLLQVLPPDAPSASMVLGTANPLVGDVLRITDTTKGSYHYSSKLTFNGETQTRDYRSDASKRTFEIPLKAPGWLELELEATGLGGATKKKTRVEVASKAIRPLARLAADQTVGRGLLPLRLENLSEGTVYHCEYWVDGQRYRVEGLDDFRISLGPGEHKIKLVAYGAEEFSPSTSEILEVNVLPPYPSWVHSLWWSVPLALSLLTLGGFGFVYAHRRREHQQLLCLGGTLIYKSPELDISGMVEFESRSHVEELPLTDSITLIVRSSWHEGVRYNAELHRNEVLTDSIELEPDLPQDLGEFELTYHA